VRYTIVGALRLLKKEILREGSVVDFRCLVGVKGGIDPLTLFHPLVCLIVPYVRIALEMGANRIRIVIPCNSLAQTTLLIREAFKEVSTLLNAVEHFPQAKGHVLAMSEKFAGARIEVPCLPELVLEELSLAGVQNAWVLGTQSAIVAYREAANRLLPPAVDIYEWPLSQNQQFQEVLRASIMNGSIPLIEKPTGTLVSGCTDIQIPGTWDSLSVLAHRMAVDAYAQ
jgi:hypothetical protein